MPLSAETIDRIRSTPDTQRIVIIGRGAVMNVGHKPEQVLDAIWTGETENTVDLVKNPPFHAASFVDRWDGEEIRIGNPLKLIPYPGGELLDLTKHFNSKELKISHLSAQIAVIAARQAVFEAGYWKDGNITPQQLTAVVTGTSVGGALSLLEYDRLYEQNIGDGRAKRALAYASTVFLPGQAAAFVGNDLNARGPRNIVSSECDTANTVLKDAIALLTSRQNRIGALADDDPRSRDAELVIAVATDVPITQIALRVFSSILGRGALSSRNDDPATASRPWDAGADGFVFGEGVITLALQTLADVRKYGDEGRILGEVLSVGHVSDPKSSNPIFPSESAITETMQLALDRAGLGASEVDGIHAHATSTGNSEITESAAIKGVFGNLTEEKGGIPVISTKSVTGHPLVSAGLVGVLVGLEAFKRGEFPPNWNLFNRNPKVAGIWLPTEHVRRTYDVVMVNAQGFGGSNGSALIARFLG